MRRRKADQRLLSSVRAGDIFNSERCSMKPNEYMEDPLPNTRDLDENITRLLSESDTSIEKQGRKRSDEKFQFSMGGDFIGVDLGTPLAITGSPNVMEEDEEISMDVSCEFSPGSADDCSHPVFASPRCRIMKDDSVGNTSSESFRDDGSDLFGRHGSFHSQRDSERKRQDRKRCLSSKEMPVSQIRPLPDPSAFDDDCSGPRVVNSSLCPPTPLRTPGWHSSLNSTVDTYNSLESITADTSIIASSPFLGPQELKRGGGVLMTRQNSLGDNKVLVEQDDDSPNHLVPIAGASPIGTCSVMFYRDFDVLGLIGDGNFAEVYKVRARGSVGNEGLYAVKKMKQQFRSRKFRDYLLNEVRVMKSLGHSHCPYVLSFYRAWQEDGYFYMQVGLAKGGCLKDLIAKMVRTEQLFPDSVLWRVLHDVSAGLNHIHSCNYVHLDIKPANLLIDEGRVLIGDFGMASETGTVEDGREGDTRYMASELLGYTARLPSSDLFSLGLTLYEMAFDLQRLRRNLVVLPSDGIHWHELRNGTYEKLRDRSPNLTSLIYALMSPEPTARPSGAALLTVEEVSRSKHEDCELLLSAQLNLAASFQYHRTQSFNPLMVPSEMDESALLVNGMRVITPH